MNKLYPIKFKPIFKGKIWGGKKIKKLLNDGSIPEMEKCGEAWVLSGFGENQTVVENGFLKDNELSELIEIYMDDLVGENTFEKFGNEFPLLIKLIDANDYLSIQVHPDDDLAKSLGLNSGKTEMWYIIDADENAELISGFNRKMDEKTYLKYFKDKKLKEILNFEKVKKGDVFYIPSGRVHALGPGVLLAEIQQAADVTYRIYDWDRVDKNGNSRELHTDLALKAIDFEYHDNYKTNYKIQDNKTSKIVDTPFFTTNIINFNKTIQKDYTELDSFVIYTCVEGSYELVYDDYKLIIKKGETVLLPAITEKVILRPLFETKILEVFIY